MKRELRVMTEEDISAVYDIAVKSFEYPWSMNKCLETMKLSFIHPVVALCDGVISGYCYTSVMYEESEIFDVAVAPEYRKAGIGQMLMDEAIAYSKENGAERMLLEVASKNTAAQTLYKNNGFITSRVREKYYQDGDDAYIMELTF